MARTLWRSLRVAFWTSLSTVVWSSQATVTAIHGIVEKQESTAAEWVRITPGEKLSDGDSLRTLDASQADLATSRGHRFHLNANSTWLVIRLSDDQTVTRLQNGSVVSKVKHLKSNEQFSLQTPTAVCAVRGTEFETTAGESGTFIAVYKGMVGVSTSEGSAETAVRAGQMTSVRDGHIELPHRISRTTRAAAESALSRTAHHEVRLDLSRNQVIASAALERRLSDYQEGKNLVDAQGQRVRIEEYIVRPEPNQFKFVVLDERGASQLDYFYYQGTFNKNLPPDLSVALRDLSGSVGSTAPAYYLTAYDMAQSNTVDSIHDTGTGGHLVKISVDGSGNYTLVDPNNPATTHSIVGTQLQSDGTYKVYDPLSDSFSVVTAAQKDAASKFGVYISENDTFRDLAPNDTLWETRFDTYQHALDNVTKITYTKATNVATVLSTSLDAAYTYAGGFVVPVVNTDPQNVDATITNYYGDGTFEQYRTVLIDNYGSIAPLSAFAGVSTGASYKNELLQWNYEQIVSASEFQGRKLDLVVEHKIFIESGLIP